MLVLLGILDRLQDLFVYKRYLFRSSLFERTYIYLTVSFCPFLCNMIRFDCRLCLIDVLLSFSMAVIVHVFELPVVLNLCDISITPLT